MQSVSVHDGCIPGFTSMARGWNLGEYDYEGCTSLEICISETLKFVQYEEKGGDMDDACPEV